MAGEDAQSIDKQRAATGECVNAQACNRVLSRMPVRGLAKVRSVVGLLVLAHNLLRTAVRAPQIIGWGVVRLQRLRRQPEGAKSEQKCLKEALERGFGVDRGRW